MVNLTPTGQLNEYNKEMEIAAQVLIISFIKRGYEYIQLKDLYEILSADTKALQTSVRWAVRRAKDENVISKIKGFRGLYSVCK